MSSSKEKGVRCSCGSKTGVIDSRDCAGGKQRRRRRCAKCGARFTTHEQRDDAPKERCFVVVHTIGEDDHVHTKMFRVTPEAGCMVAMQHGKVVAIAIKTPILRMAS